MTSTFTYKLRAKVLVYPRLYNPGSWFAKKPLGNHDLRHQPRHGPVLSGKLNPPVGWSGIGPTESVPHDAPDYIPTCSTSILQL